MYGIFNKKIILFKYTCPIIHELWTKSNTQGKKIEMIAQEVQQYYNSKDIQHLYNAKEYIDSVENEENSCYFF